MSDHRPKTMDSERLSDFMAGLKDGQLRVGAVGDHLAVAVKCSHVEDGACAECLVPLLGTLAKALKEVASLRAEVARLTEERDGFRNGQDQVQHTFDLLWSDVHGRDGLVAQMKIAAESLRASRALADRLAEALVEARTRLDDEAESLCWCHMPPGLHSPACVAARAALREWEEARRG